MSSLLPIARVAIAIALLCASVALVACGGDDDDSAPAATTAGPTGSAGAQPAANAHIDKASGVFTGLEPDDREGTKPPPVAEPDLEAAADTAGCELELDLPDELAPLKGNGHIPPGAPEPKYKTDPPTSGAHSPAPTADGAYLDTPPPTGVVHSLEHGRVTIQYSPDLPEKDQLLLKGLFDEDFKGLLLFPNPEMPYDVAVTAWTNLAGCESFDESVLDVVRDFRDEFRGKGPERIPL